MTGDRDLTPGSGLEAIATLQAEVRHLIVEVHNLNEQVAGLTNQANRWKGAFGVILLVGGILGSFATLALTKFWK